MAQHLDTPVDQVRHIFIKNELESRYELIAELGVNTLFDVTLLSTEDMKKIYKFTYIEQRKLRDIQIECAGLVGIDPLRFDIYPPTLTHTPQFTRSILSEPIDSEVESLHFNISEDTESIDDVYQSLSTQLPDLQQPISLSGYATPPTHQTIGTLDSEQYPMVRNKDGFIGVGMLIINKDYINLGGKSTRLGAQQDMNMMKEVFTDIGLFIDDSLVLINESGCNLLRKIENILEYLSQLLEDTSCIFVVISSHGNEDSICCVDNSQISIINQLIPLFKNDRCKPLLGKPKVFLIQTCRGHIFDQEVTADHIDDNPFWQKQLRNVSTIETDIVLGNACVYAYSALRDVEKGSWFIQAFKQAYFRMKNRDFCDIYSILTLTNHLMVSEFEHKSRKQPSQFTSSLTRLFILPKNDKQI